ncbi:Hypothetical protein Minf_1492 [Methylacidiphilum infernorum V4]|uniref:Uncharacterized protein n=1 Tax=Methylacidiphilum infernorum (isolate V4) TaxID=481448 RepID=B3DW43_METI4|nr:Hypothetical protein Minf_1492 [Methylacidiphilum infernorum V4]
MIGIHFGSSFISFLCIFNPVTKHGINPPLVIFS